MLAGQDRRRLAIERWQIVHEIVERLHLAAPRVAKHLIEPMLFRCACEQSYAACLRLFELGRHFGQHGDAARHMKPADTDLNAGVAELAREVHRAGILIRLHADDADQRPPTAPLQVADDPFRMDAPVGVIIGLDGELDSWPQSLTLPRVLDQTVHAGKGVGRQRRAEPLDRIAVVVVVRRLDENESK